MQYDEGKNKLDRLEKKLYSRNTPEILDKGRTAIDHEEEVVSDTWQQVDNSRFDELAQRMSRVANQKHHIVRKIFIASLAFFILSIGVAAFVFLGGTNLVSSKNVDIKVLGPVSVGGGQQSSFDISIVNQNNTDLEAVNLIVEYPEGTRDALDLSKDLRREKFDVGTIESGKSHTQKIAAVFFGEKESVKQIKLSVEYRVANSSATFFKEKNYEVTISSAPVIITPTYPKEVNSNQDIVFSIEVASNSSDTLTNFLINVEYPFGFVQKSVSPEPLSGTNVWKFASLKSGEKKTITIRGAIIGQNNEERVFRINAGTASEDDERQIGVPIAQLTESLTVKRPFIGLSMSIDGRREGDVAGRGGEDVNVEFTVRNNLPTRLFRTAVSVSLSGAALDKNKITAGQNGFYRSIDNTIVWDERIVSELADLAPGEEKTFSFKVTPLPYNRVSPGARPEINISLNTEAERVLDSGSVEKVNSNENRRIVLGTDINVYSKVARSQGNIENTGPIPPKAETPTTYTIIWGISNSFNQVSGIEVRAGLPSYVKWTGVVSPQSENVSYNPVTNEVVWKAGSVLSNTGPGGVRKEVAFQLEFLPSISQINTSPVLITAPTLTGIDKATSNQVRDVGSEGTTNFNSDPTFRSGDAEVVR